MISAKNARGLMTFDKAVKFISKNVKAAALAGKDEYVYTTNYKSKASKIVRKLKDLGYNVRFVHTPNGVRKHKIVVRW